MKAKLFYLIFTISICQSSIGIAQSAKLSYVPKRNVDGQITNASTKGLQIENQIIDTKDSQGFSLALTGENAFLITEKITDPGELQFSHRIAQPGDDFNFTIDVSTDQDMWTPIKSLPDGIDQKSDNVQIASNVFTFKTYYVDYVGACYVRIRFNTWKSGSLYLDRFRILEITDDAKKAEEDRREDEKFTKELTDQLKNDLQYDDANQTAKNLIGPYKNQVETFEILLHHIKIIEIIYDAIEFTYIRTKMSNPNRYPEFKDIVKKVKANSDTVYKKYLDDLTQIVKLPELPAKPSGLSGENKFKSFLSIGYNLGNIITGGKLQSVFNSFKGIVSTAYYKNNLLALRMDNQSIYVSPEKKGQDVPMKKSVLDEIKVKINDGIDTYNKVSKFFTIIEKEEKRVEALVVDLMNSNKGLDTYRENLNNVIKSYFKEINYTINDETIEQIRRADNTTKDQLVTKINDYFDNLVGDKKTYSQRRQQVTLALKALNENLQMVDNIKLGYLKEATILRDRFIDFQTDLEKGNPFEDAKEDFSEAYKTWNNDKNDAESKIKGKSNDIDETFIIYVKNKTSSK